MLDTSQRLTLLIIADNKITYLGYLASVSRIKSDSYIYNCVLELTTIHLFKKLKNNNNSIYCSSIRVYNHAESTATWPTIETTQHKNTNHKGQ